MRLFTAIDIPPGIADRLSAPLDRLRPLAKLSWTALGNLHITTKFIGEWPDHRLDEVMQALRAVPCPGPIEIAVRGLGWFPNDRNPRVFWAGIESSPALHTLAHDTERSLAAVGVAVEERAFQPHLTLARNRNRVSVDRVRQELATIPSADFGCFRAESFFLYLSGPGNGTIEPVAAGPSPVSDTGMGRFGAVPTVGNGEYVKLTAFALAPKS